VTEQTNENSNSPNADKSQHETNEDFPATTGQLQDPVINLNQANELELYDNKRYFNPDFQPMRPTSSIEAVNLNSWPTSSNEASPEQQMDKLGINKIRNTISLSQIIFL
jgi:hypothetical protein